MPSFLTASARDLSEGPLRFSIGGVMVDCVSMHQAVRSACATIETERLGYFVFCTASSVLAAADDAAVGAALRDASVVAPDGMPLVWLGRYAGSPHIERVYGPEFLLRFLDETKNAYAHYFFGGSPDTTATMIRRLQEDRPWIRVAGWHSPGEVDKRTFRREDVDLINASGADVVWVGLGHPKQELWMHTHRAAIESPLLAGVGAAFDFLSGRKKEAPGWMQRAGLQWLHRLVHEPRRMWRRYLIGNVRFSLVVARDLMRRPRG